MAVPVGMPDHALLTRARDGDGEAFEALYRRHHRAAARAAHSYSSRSQLAEDAVQEAFMRILHATQEGGGPITEFRAYLATTVRHVIAGWTRGERTIATDELEALAGEDLRDTSRPESRLRWHLLTKAFKSLPTRWQEALWLGEVEGVSPAELAERWNMSPNSAAALSYRAREGLRTAWLDAHVNEGLVPDECRPYVSDLSRYTQGKLTDRRETQVRGHLDDCEYCRAVLFEVDAAASELRVLLLPIAIWGGLALAGAGLSTGPLTWVAKRLDALGRRGLAFGAASTVAVVVVAALAMNPGAADPLGSADDGGRVVVSTGDDGSADDDEVTDDEADDGADEPTDDTTGTATDPTDDEQVGPTVTPGGGGTTTRNPPVDAPSRTPAPGGSVPTAPGPTAPVPTGPPVTTPTNPPPTVPPVTNPSDPTDPTDPTPEPPAPPVLSSRVTDGVIELYGTGEPGATVSVVVADVETATTSNTSGASRSVLPRGPVALPGVEIGTTTVEAHGSWSVTIDDVDSVAGLTLAATQTIDGRRSGPSLLHTVPARPAAPLLTAADEPDGRFLTLTLTAQAGATVWLNSSSGVEMPEPELGSDGTATVVVDLATASGTEITATQTVGGLISPPSVPVVLPVYELAALTVESYVEAGEIVFTGIGEPGASVTVTGDGIEVQSAIDGDGSWSASTPALPALSEVQVTATQRLGSLSSQSEPTTTPLIVPPGVPAVWVGLVLGDSAQILGTGTPGATILVLGPEGEQVGQTYVDALGMWTIEFEDERIGAGGLTVVVVQVVNGIPSLESDGIPLRSLL